jgi:hypothetical protein
LSLEGLNGKLGVMQCYAVVAELVRFRALFELVHGNDLYLLLTRLLLEHRQIEHGLGLSNFIFH